jgi:hypothetical protein
MTSELAVYDETGTVEAEVRDCVDAHIVTFRELAAADTAPGMTDGGDYVKAAFLSGRDAVVIAFAAGDIQCLSVTTGALVALLAGTLDYLAVVADPVVDAMTLLLFGESDETMKLAELEREGRFAVGDRFSPTTLVQHLAAL